MALIFVAGPSHLFAELGELVPMDHHDYEELPGGQQRISAYVDEAAIPAIQSLGLEVEVVMTDAQYADHLASFDEKPPVG